MNFHSDEWIMDRVREHYNEALEYFEEDEIIGIFYQGSANYNLDYEGSDVDTKLIVVPNFADIALNANPISTTHIRDNDEHIDFKDIRLYMQTFRKMNINFLEILFTKYKIINPKYEDEWNKLIQNRERICQYDPIKAMKSMCGQAKTKYKNLEHVSPASKPYIEKFGYVPKELHHILRIQEYMKRYISGESYENCLVSEIPEYLKSVKCGCYSVDDARRVAYKAILDIESICDDFCKEEHKIDMSVSWLLDKVQYNIMKIAIKEELST